MNINLSLAKKITSLFSVAPAVIMFSHSGKPTGIVIVTAHRLKHPAAWKTARQLLSPKSLKLLPAAAGDAADGKHNLELPAKTSQLRN